MVSLRTKKLSVPGCNSQLRKFSSYNHASAPSISAPGLNFINALGCFPSPTSRRQIPLEKPRPLDESFRHRVHIQN